MCFPDPALSFSQQYLLSSYYVPGAVLGTVRGTPWSHLRRGTVCKALCQVMVCVRRRGGGGRQCVPRTGPWWVWDGEEAWAWFHSVLSRTAAPPVCLQPSFLLWSL